MISTRTFLYNGIWLFFLTLVPFTTKWVGSDTNAAFPEFLYAFIMLMWSLMFEIMDRQILRDNPSAEKDPTNSRTYRLALYGGFVLAMIISFFSPLGSLIVMALTSVALTTRMFFMEM